MTEPSQDKLMPCDCFGNSGLHASTHTNAAGERCCDLCGRLTRPTTDKLMPTEEMIEAGICKAGEIQNAATSAEFATAIYIAMEAARPTTDVSTDGLVETIFRVLRDWRLSTMVQGDEPTEGYPLIDAVSTPTGTIESGETELGEIAATIAEALQRSNAAKDEALIDIRNRILCPVGPSPTLDEIAEIASKALSHSSEQSND